MTGVLFRGGRYPKGLYAPGDGQYNAAMLLLGKDGVAAWRNLCGSKAHQ